MARVVFVAAPLALLAQFCFARPDGTCGADVQRLEQELKEAKAALKQQSAQCKTGSTEAFSVTDLASRVWGLGSSLFKHALDQTTIDEQIAEAVTTNGEKAKAFTADVVAKVSSIDYAAKIEELKSHELYLKHVSNHVDTVAKAARPYVEEYVNPALKTAQENYATATKKVESDVLPVLKETSIKALDKLNDAPKHAEEAKLYFNRILDPIFHTCERIAPEHAAGLPKQTMDRVLLILVSLVVTYHLFFLGLRGTRFTLAVVRVLLKIVRVLLLAFVKTPLKVLGMFLWIGTGFYCCGLCSRRNKAKELAEKKGKDINGTNGNNGAAVKDATVAEVTTLLEAAKKEKKLEAAAKELVKLMKSGKAMSQPKSMVGKKVTKDVCQKAIAKFKDIDAKKLGL